MQAVIDRVMLTYDLLANRTAAASDEARLKLTEYLATLSAAGETKAFSSEVETGSREENASKQTLRRGQATSVASKCAMARLAMRSVLRSPR